MKWKRLIFFEKVTHFTSQFGKFKRKVRHRCPSSNSPAPPKKTRLFGKLLRRAKLRFKTPDIWELDCIVSFKIVSDGNDFDHACPASTYSNEKSKSFTSNEVC